MSPPTSRQNRPPLAQRVALAVLRTARLARAPIWLYRAHLGGLLGSRLLMLEHRGRITGQPRRVVLEVVDHPTPQRYVVASGFGSRAQWFQNVRAQPDVRIWVGRHARIRCRARVLTKSEAAQALAPYVARHGGAWSSMRPVLEATLGAPIDVESPALPLVAFDLQ